MFLFAIDWIMKKTRAQGKTGIQWTLLTQLDDLDFADDIALLSHTQQQMQAKTNLMAEVTGSIRLHYQRKKVKLILNLLEVYLIWARVYLFIIYFFYRLC